MDEKPEPPRALTVSQSFSRESGMTEIPKSERRLVTYRHPPFILPFFEARDGVNWIQVFHSVRATSCDRRQIDPGSANEAPD